MVLTQMWQDGRTLGGSLVACLRGAQPGQRFVIETAESFVIGEEGPLPGTTICTLIGPQDEADILGSVGFVRFQLPDGGSVGGAAVWLTGRAQRL